MKNKTQKTCLEIAEQYGIRVEISSGNDPKIMLYAPDGYEFHPDQHFLGASTWLEAIKIVQEHGPKSERQKANALVHSIRYWRKQVNDPSSLFNSNN